jgi:hypothetical protein
MAVRAIDAARGVRLDDARLQIRPLAVDRLDGRQSLHGRNHRVVRRQAAIVRPGRRYEPLQGGIQTGILATLNLEVRRSGDLLMWIHGVQKREPDRNRGRQGDQPAKRTFLSDMGVDIAISVDDTS